MAEMPPLKAREALFVRHYSTGKSAAEAARLAGYSQSYARHRAHELTNRPAIKAALAESGAALKAATLYGAETAMRELSEAIAFARKTSNATAYAKCVELRMRLHGLLIDKVEHGSVGSFSITITGVDGEPIDVESRPVPALSGPAQEVAP